MARTSDNDSIDRSRPGPVPALRMDLRFVREKDSSRFRLCDPTTGRFIELYELECLVAQAIDGTRSFADLGEFARAYNQGIRDEQVEQLLVQLSELQLLEGEYRPQEMARGSSPQETAVPRTTDEFAAFRNEVVLDLERNNALNWAGSPHAPRRAPLFEAAAPSMHPAQAAPDDDGEDFLGGSTNLADGESPFPENESTHEAQIRTSDVYSSSAHTSDVYSSVPRTSDVFTSAQPQQAPAAPAPAPAAPSQHTTRSTPEAARNEQEELFKRSQKKRRFYHRTSVRLLVLLALLVGASTVIEYPLHITSETSIVPSKRAYVRSPIGGVISEILVDEGSVVKKGDIIAKLDDRDLNADRRKALAEIEGIQADLQRVRKGPRAQEIAQQRAVVAARSAAVTFAQKESARRANMVAEGVGSKQAAAEAGYDLQLKRNALNEASAALRLLEAGSRPEEIAALEAMLKRATAELEFIEQKLGEMIVIRSPIDGTILTPRFHERLHERIESGGLVAEVSDTSTVLAEVFVLEREADSVAIGMPVTVKVESYPLHAFHGTVDFIAPAVESRNKNNVVRVVAKLDNRDGMLRQDMTGYGEMDCGKRSLASLASRRFLRWIRVRFLL